MQAGRLSYNGVTLPLFITRLSYSLNGGTSPVLAQDSVYFTASKPSQPSIDFQILQPSPKAMNAAVGLLQRWSQKNALVLLSVPELGISYKGFLSSAAYKWQYDSPEPAMDVSMTLATSLFYTEWDTDLASPSIWQYFTESVVTRNATQLQQAVQSMNQNAASLTQEQYQQQIGAPDAVVSWVQRKLQFKGYHITYNGDGTISVEQNGMWARNLQPSLQLLKALKTGNYHVEVKTINIRDDWNA